MGLPLVLAPPAPLSLPSLLRAANSFPAMPFASFTEIRIIQCLYHFIAFHPYSSALAAFFSDSFCIRLSSLPIFGP